MGQRATGNLYEQAFTVYFHGTALLPLLKRPFTEAQTVMSIQFHRRQQLGWEAAGRQA